MKVVETTYRTKENKEELDEIMGVPYSFMQSWKLKGKGSGRMIVEECSVGLITFCNNLSGIQYVSFELRPNGLIAHINNAKKTYAWLVPFYRLYLYKTRGMSIHDEGQFLRLKDDRLLRENRNFFEKLMRCKLKYDQDFPSTGNGQLSHSAEL
ncbi:MAG: hypothetical protein ACI9EV_002296 [Urechidicola sp.]|jgi:hypothetical protein